MSSLKCEQLREPSAFMPKLKDRNNDFWVSSLAGTDPSELEFKLRTLRVEESLASEAFTHCFFMESPDIKADTDQIIDAVGLGLRKTRVRSKNVQGVVYAFVNEKGESSLHKARENLDATDKRLSTEERVRRTTMSIEVVASLDAVIAEGRRDRAFWATQWQACDVEEAKRKAVSTQMEGQLATERFSRCLLTEAKCCSQVVSRFEAQCGQGLRTSRVRCRPGPGTFAVFFTGYYSQAATARREQARAPAAAAAASTSTALVSRNAPSASAAPSSASSSSSSSSSRQPPPAAGAGGSSSPPKRRRIDLDLDGGGDASGSSGGPLLPFAGPAPPLTTPAKTSGPARTNRPAQATTEGKAPPPAVHEDSEELHCKQVDVIERRLGQLLPKLPLEELSTDLVQTKLEDLLQRPRGRLQKFRFDIARIWRKYQEEARERQRALVPDLD